MEKKKIQSYESLFNINIQDNDRSIEKIDSTDKNKAILKKVLRSKKYNKKLFQKILFSLENTKTDDKAVTLKDKIKHALKIGKNFNMAEYMHDKKTFDERFICTLFFTYSDNFAAGKDVINKLIESQKSEISKKCKSFEKDVKATYPTAKSKLDFKVKKQNRDGDEIDLLFIATFDILIPLHVFISGKSSESLNENIEQNNIISRDINLFSIEDDGGSFEEAAGDDNSDNSDGGNNGWDDGGEGGEIEEPEMPSMDGDGGGDDSGGDSGDGGDDGGWGDDDSGNEDGDSEDKGKKVDVFDPNKGSSMNPFTQINQKLYQLETLNGLRLSIKKAVDLYSAQYADWSEVCQLKELGEILDEERKSFMMQQNPENLMKLGLYYDQYDKLVQNIFNKISKINANDRR